MTFRDVFENEVAANAAGPAAIAGIGIGPEGEPGVDKKKNKKRSALLWTQSRGTVDGN